MPEEEYAVSAYWRAEAVPDVPESSMRSWTLQINNEGLPFDLLTTTISIASPDGMMYRLDLSHFGFSKIVLRNSQLDIRKIPEIYGWNVGAPYKIVCEIRAPRSIMIQADIGWPLPNQ